jgi:hypothetical protein
MTSCRMPKMTVAVQDVGISHPAEKIPFPSLALLLE